MKQTEATINELYANNADKLHRICHKEMARFGGISPMDYDDFYSRAGYEITLAKKIYNPSAGKSFTDYIFGVIRNSVCKEMTYRNRGKRQSIVETEEKDTDGNIIKIKEYSSDIPIDMPLGDGENSVLGDILADKRTVEKEIFEDNEDGYSNKMRRYLGRLSLMQKKVLKLSGMGFTPNEIMEELDINQKMYYDCYEAIHSYRNTSILL